MKKTLSLLLVFAMILAMLPGTALAAGSYTETTPYEVGNDTELVDAINWLTANEGGHIKLTDNITTTAMIKVEGNKPIVLDLNGHTITANDLKDTSNFVLWVTTGDNVTINDASNEGGIINNSTYGYAILNQGALTVNGGTFTGDMALWNGYDTINSVATLNGGVFNYNVADAEGYSVGNSGTLIINDGAVINDWVETYGALTVNGGTIENIYACTGVTAAAVGTTISGGTVTSLTVEEGNPATVTGGTFTDLAAAVKYAADGATIKLAGDVTLAEAFAVDGKSLTIDLNKFTLYPTTNYNVICHDATLTMKNGTIDISNVDIEGKSDRGIFAVGGAVSGHATGGHMVLTDVDLTGKTFSTGDNGGVFMLYQGGEEFGNSSVNITGGSIDLDTNTTNGAVFYGGGSTCETVLNITGTTMTIKDVARTILYNTATLKNCDITISAGEKGFDNGFNEVKLTVDNSKVNISGGTGRALTINSHAYPVSIKNGSVLTFSDMGEGEIRFKGAADLSIDATSTLNTCDIGECVEGATINGEAVKANQKVGVYPVTFNSNSGTINAGNVVSYAYGTEVFLPTDVTRANYTFGGWYDNAELTGDAITAITATDEGAKTFYAKWVPVQYTITFNSNGGSDVASQTVAYGSTVSKPADPTLQNKEFIGWYTGEELTAEYDFNTVVTAPVTLYARWDNFVDFTAGDNAAFPNGAPFHRVIVPVGNSVKEIVDVSHELLDPSREGYDFGGWYADPACTQSFNFNEVLAESTVAFAKWTIKTYTVTLDANGGTYEDSTTTKAKGVNHGVGLNLSQQAIPTRSGYTFAGWKMGETTYASTDTTAAITADTTLTAQWTESSGGYIPEPEPEPVDPTPSTPVDPTPSTPVDPTPSTPSVEVPEVNDTTIDTSAPTVTTETKEDEEGNTVTTETKEDGTVVETTQKADGSTTTTATKSETTEDAEGNKTTTSTTNNTTTTADGTTVTEQKQESKTEAADGSVTTTVTESTTTTDAAGATVTEQKQESTTEAADGSKTTTTIENTTSTDAEGNTAVQSKVEEKVETETATVTTTTTTTADAAGNTEKVEAKEETVINEDGTTTTTTSSTTETALANGSTGTTVVDTEGNVTADVTISEQAVADADAAGETVTLPMPAVSSTASTETAPVINVTTSTTEAVTVEIPVAEAKAGTVVVIVKEDGTEEVVTKTVQTEGGLSVQVEGNVTVKVVDNAKQFSDTEDHWAADAIDHASSRELFNGVGGNSFAPDTTMNRAMLATVLWRMEGKQEATTESDFHDLEEGHWSEEAVHWAAENEIIKGSNGAFDGEGAVTREQMVTMLYRMVGSPEVDAEDAVDGASDWAADAVAWAVKIGLMKGSNGNLDLQGSATRAQIATFLQRFMNLKS